MSQFTAGRVNAADKISGKAQGGGDTRRRS